MPRLMIKLSITRMIKIKIYFPFLSRGRALIKIALLFCNISFGKEQDCTRGVGRSSGKSVKGAEEEVVKSR